MKNIYCISGLGADHRIFAHLQLPENFTLKHLPWLRPQDNESLHSYVSRMSQDIDDPDPIIMGVSFGGMVAIEIAKQRPVKKLILISSIKSKREKPFYFKIAAALRINKLIPLRPWKFLAPIENYNLGICTPEEKALASEYRENLDPKYSDWAIDQVIHWESDTYPDNILHIHGTNDHILPIRYTKPSKMIVGGGHMMVMNKAAEISEIIREALNGKN